MDPILKAANAIRSSNAIVIATGAGMGVDSGLPDLRGDNNNVQINLFFIGTLTRLNLALQVRLVF